jgi:hypothetical protein
MISAANPTRIMSPEPRVAATACPFAKARRSAFLSPRKARTRTAEKLADQAEGQRAHRPGPACQVLAAGQPFEREPVLPDRGRGEGGRQQPDRDSLARGGRGRQRGDGLAEQRGGGEIAAAQQGCQAGQQELFWLARDFRVAAEGGQDAVAEFGRGERGHQLAGGQRRRDGFEQYLPRQGRGFFQARQGRVQQEGGRVRDPAAGREAGLHAQVLRLGTVAGRRVRR